MNQEQGTQEQHQEGDVLGVEEGVGVEPGLEHEQQQGDQGQPAAVEEVVHQPGTAAAAGQKEEVGQQMTAQVDVPAVGEVQQPLNEYQRHLEDNAVEPIGGRTGGPQGLGIP